MAALTTNRGRRFHPEPLSSEEAKALVSACSRRAPTGVRNRALIVVLYRAGLRISEALTLRVKDLDQDAGTIRVLQGKGGRTRLVGLDPGAWAILQLWLDRRPQLGLSSKHPVFCTLSGEPLKDSYCRALLPRLAAKAGIEKRVHPHGLRHSFAFELANEGVPVHAIQALLGHASLSTTAVYLSHLNPMQVVAHVRRRSWNL